jgi:hypothetical protein
MSLKAMYIQKESRRGCISQGSNIFKPTPQTNVKFVLDIVLEKIIMLCNSL